MNLRATEFAESWLDEHIHPEPYGAEDSPDSLAAYVSALLSAAGENGVDMPHRRDLPELRQLVRNRMREVREREISRLMKSA